MSAEEQSPKPPDPPEVRRRIQLYRHQWIGVTLLMAIPLAALAGLFGERTVTLHASSDLFDVDAVVPAVLRYRQTKALRISVTSRAAAPLDSPRIAFDTAYVLRFANLRFTPSQDESYTVTLPPLAPGGSAVVNLELQADRYGRHEGQLHVRAGGASVTLALHTWILP